jgi:hypothetical protein
MMRARLRLASGATAEGLDHARLALENARAVKSGDAIADRHAIARVYRLVGDIRARGGDIAAGKAAWAGALAAMPRGVPERPGETSERAVVLEKLGRRAEAQQLAAKLNAIGYRRSTQS